MRKIYGYVKEGERGIRTNKEMKDILQGEDIYEIPPPPRLRWCGHVERMQNQEMPKQIAVTVMEGTRRRGRPGKTWRDEVEGAVNVTGVKNRREMDRGEVRKGVLVGSKGEVR